MYKYECHIKDVWGRARINKGSWKTLAQPLRTAGTTCMWRMSITITTHITDHHRPGGAVLSVGSFKELLCKYGIVWIKMVSGNAGTGLVDWFSRNEQNRVVPGSQSWPKSRLCYCASSRVMDASHLVFDVASSFQHLSRLPKRGRSLGLTSFQEHKGAIFSFSGSFIFNAFNALQF